MSGSANAGGSGTLPLAMDLSQHLNAKSKARHPSPLKDIIKFMAYDGMISLSGGLPHPSLFPFRETGVVVVDPLSKATAISGLETQAFHLDNGSTPPLAKFLQYGTCEGNAELRRWAHEFTRKIHRPPYSDFEILLHPGNTNAWSKIVGLLVEAGDYILTENFTYPSSQALWIPQGNFAAPVELDDQGVRADALEDILSTWDVTHPGVKRPHVLYMVSVGSNPTGLTMGAERKRAVYNTCVKYDIIIVEDDPYYFLQYPEYKAEVSNPADEILPPDKFLESLTPSLLRYDYQGRVIRLESFSKSLAPGLRLGYFVTNPIFSERLLRATEVETQDPSGFSQAIVYELLKNWGIDGYLVWQQRLRMEYQARRDCLIDAFAANFELLPAGKISGFKGEGLVACLQDANGSTPIFNFVGPTGGMFIWTKFLLSQNPRFQQLSSDRTITGAEEIFAKEFWSQLAENLILLTPGSYYYPWQGGDDVLTKVQVVEPESTYFRFCFSMATEEQMKTGIERFAAVVKKSWNL